VSLIFGNIAEEDILMRKELEEMVQQHPGRVKVCISFVKFTLSIMLKKTS